MIRALMIILAIVFCVGLTGCSDSAPDKPAGIEENVQPAPGEVKSAPGVGTTDEAVQTGGSDGGGG